MTNDQIAADVRTKLDGLRKEYVAYQQALEATDRVSRGITRSTKRLSAADVSRRARAMRDEAMTQRAVSELYDLLYVLYQREPSEEEMISGPPAAEDVRSLPQDQQLLSSLSSAAQSLGGVFGYLRAGEERIQDELGVPRAGSSPSRAGTAVRTVFGLAALGTAGYFGYRWLSNRFSDDDADDEYDEDEDVAPVPASPTININVPGGTASPAQPITDPFGFDDDEAEDKGEEDEE